MADAGMAVERVDEPPATEETAAAQPEVAETRLLPYFLHLRPGSPPPASGPVEQA